MRRAGERRHAGAGFAAAALAASLCFGGCADRLPAREGTMSLLLTLEKSCPDAVVEVLETLCDDANTLSGGTLHMGLQFRENVLEADGELAFVLLDEAAGISEELHVPSSPFLFSTAEEARMVMNASDILARLGDALGTKEASHTVQSVFFCGQSFLLTGDPALTGFFEGDGEASAELLVPGERPLAADFGAAPEEGALYSARTEELYTLPGGIPHAYTLIDMPYRMHFGLLLASEGLRERLGPVRWAAVEEAAAFAAPACAESYAHRAERVIRSAPRVVVPSGRLRRVVRAQSSSPSEDDIPLYRMIADYTL